MVISFSQNQTKVNDLWDKEVWVICTLMMAFDQRWSEMSAQYNVCQDDFFNVLVDIAFLRVKYQSNQSITLYSY